LHHQGTSHVKETRIDIWVSKFEIFEMNENESICNISTLINRRILIRDN
jgi:hypothetical protein